MLAFAAVIQLLQQLMSLNHFSMSALVPVLQNQAWFFLFLLQAAEFQLLPSVAPSGGWLQLQADFRRRNDCVQPL